MDIDNCNPLNVYLNLNTGKIECLPGVIIPPPGYSQIGPETTVTPNTTLAKIPALIVLGVLAYFALKK